MILASDPMTWPTYTLWCADYGVTRDVDVLVRALTRAGFRYFTLAGSSLPHRKLGGVAVFVADGGLYIEQTGR